MTPQHVRGGQLCAKRIYVKTSPVAKGHQCGGHSLQMGPLTSSPPVHILFIHSFLISLRGEIELK